MFTRDRSGTDPVRFSDRIGLLFTRDLSGTGPERIQNWTCCFAGPVSDPIRTGSRKVPCKHLDRFQTVPCKQKPIRSGSVRNGSGPVPCKRSLGLITLKILVQCFYKILFKHDLSMEVKVHQLMAGNRLQVYIIK